MLSFAFTSLVFFSATQGQSCSEMFRLVGPVLTTLIDIAVDGEHS